MASLRGILAPLQGIPEDLPYKGHEQHVSLQEGNETKQRRGHTADPLSKNGARAAIRGTLTPLKGVSKFHGTSTQRSKMDFHSGSSHYMFPFVFYMGMNHETSLSYGVPSGRPPKSYLMEDVSYIDAPFIDPRKEGALVDHDIMLRVQGKYRERKIIFPLT